MLKVYGKNTRATSSTSLWISATFTVLNVDFVIVVTVLLQACSPVSFYLFEFKNWNIILWSNWRRNGVSIVNFRQISDITLSN